ncbi:unnamed protein product [Parajaminaea phylloscopi]
MTERPTAAKQSFSQQVVWALTRRGATAAPLSSSATVSSPSQHPVDHRTFHDAATASAAGASSTGSTPHNPFENDRHTARPPSPINLESSDLPTTYTPESFSSHVVELLKPLPLSQPKRDQSIRERASRLHLLARATAGDHGSVRPPQGQVLRLVIALLAGGNAAAGSGSLPGQIREATLELLTEAVKLTDSLAAEAPKALVETRSGAPGSQSSKSADSDQPLATIDRALLYRLVVEDQHRVAMTSDRWTQVEKPLPSPTNLAATAVPCLHAKLRALDALSKGGREVVSFDGLVSLLSMWLSLVWREVQGLRQLSKFVDVNSQGEGTSTATTIEHHAYIENLSGREWSLSAIFHLLSSILMFSFAKVKLSSVEDVLCTASELFTEPLPEGTAPRQSLRAPLSVQAKAVSSSRSRSRDRRRRQPSLEGYSYYGTESLTPDSGTSTANSPSMTPRLEPQADRIMPASAAPISLATLPPTAAAIGLTTSRSGAAPSRTLPPSRLSSFVASEQDHTLPAFPELQDVEVRCILKLVDAALKFGYVPPGAVRATCEMLCRILGFETALTAAVSANGLASLASTLSTASLSPWQEISLPVLANLLRSHCANSCIQTVRSMLMHPSSGQVDTSKPAQHVEAKDDPSGEDAPVEDEATLAGAVLFLRFALLIIAQEALASTGAGSLAAGSSNAAAKGTFNENALAPRLSLPLLLPALRGALLRQSDLVDLQVISLAEALLIPMPGRNGEQALSLAPGGALTQEDWDELLQLTIGAQRHVDTWREAITSNSSAATEARTPPVLNALVSLLSRAPLAPSDQVGSGATAAHSNGAASQSLPWSPRLCSLMLALGPALPSKLIDALVDYHRTQHLCLPCSPEWIANIHKLMQSFLYGPYRADALTGWLSKVSKTWQEKSRKALTSFLFGDIYDAVVSFPKHRSKLLREVLIPTASVMLVIEDAAEANRKIRDVLIQAAALSSVTDDIENGEQPKIFDSVRLLLRQLAREADHYPHLVSHAHAHVHFADNPSLSQGTKDPADTGRRHSRSISSVTNSAAAPSIHEKPSRGMSFALDLISVFNVIAFASPWLDYEDAVAHQRGEQEKQAREACLALFGDLMNLLSPAPPTDAGGSEPGHLPAADPSALPSTRTRLAILQWFLHLRTDRHHRVYLTGSLDESVANAAATLLKTAESRTAAAAAAAETQASEKQRPTRGEGREPRRTTANSALESVRSKSRARDSSTERGRTSDKGADAPRRGGDRSASASRGGSQAQGLRKSAAEHETLWEVPEVLAFEMPASNLRSDIVYTYIHSDDPTCSHDHIHGHSDLKPTPLPVSALLATYIRLIETERDWELVSYLICFLPHQLANKHLFCGPKAQTEVLKLRAHLCAAMDQQKLMPDLALPEDVKRSDVYAVAYVTLTALLSYRALFTRNHQEEMVDAFVAGLNKSQNTALPCVRALSVAVYESQKSVTRLLPKILVKLSTIMSSMTMSVHILELIASIGQIPSCYANFTEADYRRVFGIALQYIQYHQSPAGSGREDFRSSPASFALSQYVMMLAYYNISLWFMTLRLSERPKHVPSITRGLLLANEGRDVLSDNSEVCFDFLSRFAHSNIDSKPTKSFMNSVVMGPNSTTPAGRAGMKEGGNRVSKTWLIGKGLVTISTLKKEGWLELVIRRSSGTTAMLCKVENAPVSTLPDEDGERTDLPAALMMGRNALMMSKPVLRAPIVSLQAAPFELNNDNTGSDDEQDDGDDDMGMIRPRKTLQQEAKESLKAGERMRSRRVLGPSHFGLASRPRSASFSGAIDEGPTTSIASDPYRLTDRDGDSQLSAAKVGAVAQEEAIARVMKDILDEGSKIQGQRGSQDADEPTQKAPTKQSAERDFAIDPSTVALQLSSYPDFLNSPPILLPDEPATARLLRAMDLTPVVDLHKIGLLYVAPGQKQETEILGNSHGSPAYARFLAGLGDLITLRGQEDLYTGGLDREQDFHGKYAYAWADDISQIVFHAATMMPNRAEADPNHSHKKALIGNDWVHIVFNESGDEYAFGTLPSQFNYVNIVISPNTKGGTALGSIGPVDTSFYRVSLQRRPGLPSFSPLGDDGQLISAAFLPIFVRSLALNANVMSQIYNDTGESMQPYSSNWCNRLNHVVRFKKNWQDKQQKKRLDEQQQQQGNSAGEGFVVSDAPEHDPRDFTAFA